MKKRILMLECGDPSSPHPAHRPRPDDCEFYSGLRELGDFTLLRVPPDLPQEDFCRYLEETDIYVYGHHCLKRQIPENLKHYPELVATITGTVVPVVSKTLIDNGLKVTHWGNAAGKGIGMLGFVQLLVALHDVPQRIASIKAGGWMPEGIVGGGLDGLRIGLYGLGAGGREFVRLLKPFGCRFAYFDPYVQSDDPDLVRLNSVKEVCAWSQVLAVYAGWTPETEGTITAECLAQLPDHGIVINPARGELFDQDALFAEIKSGRLRAALDVLVKDYLAPDDPIRQADNLLISMHCLLHNVWNPPAGLTLAEKRCLEEIRRHTAGEPPAWQVTPQAFAKMT